VVAVKLRLRQNNGISAAKACASLEKEWDPPLGAGIVANGAVTASVAGVLVTFDGVRAAARSRTRAFRHLETPCSCGDGSFAFIDQDEVGFKR